MGRVGSRHTCDDRVGGAIPARARKCRRILATDRNCQSARQLCTTLIPKAMSVRYERSTEILPDEPSEIKPHPYGVELGRLAAMLKETSEPTLSSFLTTSFSRVSPAVARRICNSAKLSTLCTNDSNRTTRSRFVVRGHSGNADFESCDRLHFADQRGLILKGLHHVVPGEFYTAATRHLGLSWKPFSDRSRAGIRW